MPTGTAATWVSLGFAAAGLVSERRDAPAAPRRTVLDLAGAARTGANTASPHDLAQLSFPATPHASALAQRAGRDRNVPASNISAGLDGA